MLFGQSKRALLHLPAAGHRGHSCEQGPYVAESRDAGVRRVPAAQATRRLQPPLHHLDNRLACPRDLVLTYVAI